MGVYEVVEGELAEDNKAIQLEEQKSQPRRVVLSLQVLGFSSQGLGQGDSSGCVHLDDEQSCMHPVKC